MELTKFGAETQINISVYSSRCLFISMLQYNNMVDQSNTIFVAVFHDRQEINLLTVINDH